MTAMDQRATPKEAFTRAADSYATHKATVDKKCHQVMVELSGAQASDRVLEVAAGPGYVAMLLAERAKEAVGIDLTPAFVAKARAAATERGLRNITFLEGDAESIPFPAGSFELVACHKAFHHFVHPTRAIAEARRVLVPGGRLLLGDTRTSDDADKARRHNEWERLRDPSHVEMYSTGRLLELVKAGGFQIERLEEWSDEVDVAWWQMVMAVPEPTYAEIRRRLQESITDDALDLNARLDAERLLHRRRHVVVAAVRG